MAIQSENVAGRRTQQCWPSDRRDRDRRSAEEQPGRRREVEERGAGERGRKWMPSGPAEEWERQGERGQRRGAWEEQQIRGFDEA